jgi:hypothetical protein
VAVYVFGCIVGVGQYQKDLSEAAVAHACQCVIDDFIHTRPIELNVCLLIANLFASMNAVVCMRFCLAFVIVSVFVVRCCMQIHQSD